MDRLTPRDLAVTRFRRNHELVESIFDERKIGELLLPLRVACHHLCPLTYVPRIATLEPVPSPYSALSASALRQQLEAATKTTEDMERVHQQRVKVLLRAADPTVLEHEWASGEKRAKEEEEKQLEPWMCTAIEGRPVSRPGFAYVRAATPESVREASRREAETVPEPSQQPVQSSIPARARLSNISVTEKEGVSQSQQQKQTQPHTQPLLQARPDDVADKDVRMEADNEVDADADADADEDLDENEENGGDNCDGCPDEKGVPAASSAAASEAIPTEPVAASAPSHGILAAPGKTEKSPHVPAVIPEEDQKDAAQTEKIEDLDIVTEQPAIDAAATVGSEQATEARAPHWQALATDP